MAHAYALQEFLFQGITPSARCMVLYQDNPLDNEEMVQLLPCSPQQGKEGREVSIPVSLYLASLTKTLLENKQALLLYSKKAIIYNMHNYTFQKAVFAKRHLVNFI